MKSIRDSAPVRPTVIERLLARRSITGSGCWEWMGARQEYGHGTIWANGKQVQTYRVAYQEWVGEIPDGWVVHHCCKNPACFNPSHLKAMDWDEHNRLGGRVKKNRSPDYRPISSIPPMLERLTRNIVVDAKGCWVWQGKRNPAGYGKIKIGPNRKEGYAHRVSYALHREEIPEGLTIDHLCGNKSCINPRHLEAVPRGENARRGQVGLDRSNRKKPTRKVPLKESCKYGHLFSESNTRFYKNRFGQVARHCRECSKLNMRRYRQEKSGLSSPGDP